MSRHKINVDASDIHLWSLTPMVYVSYVYTCVCVCVCYHVPPSGVRQYHMHNSRQDFLGVCLMCLHLSYV